MILSNAENGLVQLTGMSRQEAQLAVKNSTLGVSIDRAPDIVAHYSQEQLVCEVLR
jgi:hypothetical protein